MYRVALTLKHMQALRNAIADFCQLPVRIALHGIGINIGIAWSIHEAGVIQMLMMCSAVRT